MLMASLQTAVKNVDVTDLLNKSLEPSAFHPVLSIGGSKRKTERPCALRLCQASRGHCGVLTLKLNVLSTHITIHSHTTALLPGILEPNKPNEKAHDHKGSQFMEF